MSVYLKDPKFLTAGDSCVVVEFADEVHLEGNAAVMRLMDYLTVQRNIPIIECMPTYRSLAIYFDALAVSSEEVIKEVKAALSVSGDRKESGHIEIDIPVCYGGEYGPDIANVAEHAGISEEEVIKRHSAVVYHCYMIGFLPGFAYLGGLDETLATPRLANPRTLIAPGSVGIAGKQTGIYPIASPGGWQLIGRTPLNLFTPEAERPTLLDAGYGVRFVPISEEEFKR